MLDAHATSRLTNLASGKYRIDPERSRLEIRIKGNWGLQRVRATFRIANGSLRVDDDGRLADVSAEIDPASFFSRNKKRDAHVKSADFLDVARYPTIAFTGAGVRREGEDLILTGTVRIHGVSESVDVRVVTATMEGTSARFQATVRLERARFGVLKMPRRIGDDVELSIDVLATHS